MKHITVIVIVVLLFLASCATTRVSSTHQVDRDSIYISSRDLDSLYRATYQRDSVVQRDSVYLYIAADTVVKYVYKERLSWQIKRDTVWRDRWRADTLYTERVDSLRIEVPVYIEKPIKWYNQGFIWLGRVCLAALLLWLVYKVVRWKLRI